MQQPLRTENTEADNACKFKPAVSLRAAWNDSYPTTRPRVPPTMGCRKRVLFAALIVFGTLVGASCASGDGDAEAVAAAEVGAAEAAVDTDAAADAMAAARAAVGTALPCSLIKTISWDVKANQAVGDVCTGYLGHFTDTQQQLYTCGYVPSPYLSITSCRRHSIT